MSEQPPSMALEPISASPDGGPAAQQRAQVAALVDQRPEVAVGAAFGGGLLLALILKRLAS